MGQATQLHPPPTSDPQNRLVTIKLTLPHSEAINQDIYISSVYLPAGDSEEDTQIRQLAYDWLKTTLPKGPSTISGDMNATLLPTDAPPQQTH